MKALDTNVIIRFLVNDDRKQGAAVQGLFMKAESEGQAFFISSVVLLEILYVLDSVYEYPKADILNALESMIAMPVLVFENTSTLQELISTVKKTSVEMEDLYIGLLSKTAGCEATLTFDKKAARSGLFELLR